VIVHLDVDDGDAQPFHAVTPHVMPLNPKERGVEVLLVSAREYLVVRAPPLDDILTTMWRFR
jgi:hypothetical protein